MKLKKKKRKKKERKKEKQHYTDNCKLKRFTIKPLKSSNTKKFIEIYLPNNLSLNEFNSQNKISLKFDY